MSILWRETFDVYPMERDMLFDVYPLERDMFFDVYPIERDMFFDVYPSVIFLIESISISN